MKRILLYFLAIILIIFMQSCSNNNSSIYGRWKLDQEKSTDLVTWRYRTLELDIRDEAGKITILKNWVERKKIAFVDSVSFRPGQEASQIPVTSQIWPENWYMGVLSKTGCHKLVSGIWKKRHQELLTITEQIVNTSQGENVIKTEREYKLNRQGDLLTVQEKRSTRPTTIVLVFRRSE